MDQVDYNHDPKNSSLMKLISRALLPLLGFISIKIFKVLIPVWNVSGRRSDNTGCPSQKITLSWGV